MFAAAAFGVPLMRPVDPFNDKRFGKEPDIRVQA
jgi:hypothetical protein